MPTYPLTSPPVAALGEMSRKPRTLVLCFDGTTNEYDDTNTNVVKLYSMLRKDKVEDQITYYQAGIGTYVQPGVVSPLFGWAADILDEAIAWYLYQHVMDGYKFLMQSYNVGDKVLLFGFSRGAYTARALAGMLHKVGLLSKDNIEQIPFAYKLYKSDNNDALAQGFKTTFCREVPIEFVGVWDTVASVGVISGKTLPFVDVNTTIRVFRQALALDEHRGKFRPNLYHRSVPKKAATGGEISKNAQVIIPERAKDEVFETDMKEVWFVGCHTDVGGGSSPDSEAHTLANIPLRWMIQEIVQAECGILLDFDNFAKWGIPITVGQTPCSSTSPAVSQETGSGSGTAGPVAANEQADAIDVVQSTHDALKRTPVWWLLEIIPTSYTYQNAQEKWVTNWGLHLGRGRYVPPNPLFHESVKTRMQDPKLKYKPKAHYTQGTETYVA